MVDSILGATVQAQFETDEGRVVENCVEEEKLIRGISWVRNDVVNFVSGVAAVVIAAIYLLPK